jgi:hypothetical protein
MTSVFISWNEAVKLTKNHMKTEDLQVTPQCWIQAVDVTSMKNQTRAGAWESVRSEEYYPLRYDAVESGRSSSTFWGKIQPHSSPPKNKKHEQTSREEKIKTIYSSEKSVGFYQTSRRHIPWLPL